MTNEIPLSMNEWQNDPLLNPEAAIRESCSKTITECNVWHNEQREKYHPQLKHLHQILNKVRDDIRALELEYYGSGERQLMYMEERAAKNLYHNTMTYHTHKSLERKMRKWTLEQKVAYLLTSDNKLLRDYGQYLSSFVTPY